MSLQQLGDLFNSFRKKEDKSEAIQHVWETFISVTDFDTDIFEGTRNKMMDLAGDIIKTTAKNVAVSGGLTLAGITEGISALPALIESIVESVIGLYKLDPPETGFFPGEWITVHVGFVKDTIEDEVARGAMFDDMGDLEIEIPNYDVGFFIKYTRENRSSVFNAQKGKIMEVADTDIRSVPDQDRLDENKFLRELKALYFKKEGPNSLAETKDQVSVGKTVKWKDKIWEVLEFEPVKQAVHLLRDNEVVKTALSTIQGFDQDNQLTWLHGGSKESFPHSLVKFGFCWKTGDENQDLCVLKEMNGTLSIVFTCIDGKQHELPTMQLSPASDKLTSLLTKLPEMRRFRNDVIFRAKPMAVWTFRHLCTQSDAHRAIDKLDKVGLKQRFDEENKMFQTVDYDLTSKIKEFELAYNERAEVVRNEEGFEIVPANF
jgi:hypothetical protein